MSRKCILTLKSKTRTIKVEHVINQTYHVEYYQLTSNRRILCRPFGYNSLGEAVDVAVGIQLQEITKILGGCEK